jgi:uncharacterized membrane protein
VLAIAITILVLDLAVHPPGSPLDQFLQAWPAYLAYVVSFLTIGVTWIGHTAITDRLTHVDTTLMRLNLLFLMAVSFLPFPTRMVAESLHESTGAQRVAAVVYGLTLLWIRLMFMVLDGHARRAHLFEKGAADEDLQDARSKASYVIVAYLVTIGLGMIFPLAAILIYFAIGVVLIIPFHAAAQALRHRSGR